MKRANLYGFVFGLMVCIALFFDLAYAQSIRDSDQSYVYVNRMLSDFGDGYDQAKSIVWKATYSEYVVQVPGSESPIDQNQGAEQANAQAEVIVQGRNPDPERNSARYIEAEPAGITIATEGPHKFVLGVKAEFSRQGYNWIELRPHRLGSAQDVEKAQVQENVAAETATTNANEGLAEIGNAPDINAESYAFELPFTGNTDEITLWAWGGYYSWWVEVYVRDYLGYQYRLPMGDLRYKGWKQKRVEVPRNIPQDGKRIPTVYRLTFEMIKLWSFPSERVNQFYVYFDLLQYGSRISTDVFNGSDLAEDIW